MSKNLTRKGLALVSGSALVMTSLVGFAAPANAAPGDVALYPTTGTGTAVFTTDAMDLTTEVQTAVVQSNKLAYRIDNPDQHQLLIDPVASGAGKLIGITSTGAAVTVGTGDTGTFTDSFIVDFDDAGLNIVSLVMYDLDFHGAETSISIKLDKSNVDKFQESPSADPLVFGDRTTDAKISVQSWVEVSTFPDYRTVDTAYASDKVDVTYVDPKNVSVISEVVRSRAVGNFDTVAASPTAVKFIVFSNVASIATSTAFGAGDSLQGVNLAQNDRILFVGQSTATEDGIYTVGATNTTVLTKSAVAEDVAAMTNIAVRVTGGTYAGQTYLLTKLAGDNDITAAQPAVNNLNQVGDKFVTANLRFSRSDINLNQVVLTNWWIGMTSSETADAYDLEVVDLRLPSENWANANHNVEVVTPSGYSSANYDAYGSLLIRASVTGDALAASKTYQLRFRHSNANGSVFVSPAFTTVASPESTAVAVTSTVTSTTDAKYDAGTVTLRAGTKAFTYRAQAKLSGGVNDAKFANIPVVAVVQAGAFRPTGESIAVSGSNKSITRANETVIVSGLTNADGRFDVTVTSTTAANLQSYTVSFFLANGASAGAFVADGAPITANYATAVPTTATPTPSILASSDVSMKVKVVDQFGQAISTNSRGALNVELKAPDKTKLELFAPVTNGEASFTFKNYLTAGQSEVLSVRVYTGTSTSPTYVTALDTIATMFAPVPVTAINVPAEVTNVVVNYVDFITGKTSTAKPGPSAGATTYTGTVVNANGAGIPGAAVTITGKGFQFKSGTDFTIDSVTLTTDASGTFTVDMWTTVASATGNRLTVTSGDKTASTLVKSTLPTQLSTANLSFTWSVPATLVMNTTYAVTATVTDKWGNPVVGANVQFSAFGSAQFNGANTPADRLTDRTGKATAFLRSFLNVDGPAAIGATLTSVPGTTPSPALSAALLDVATTAWDESKWTNVIESQVNFLKSGTGAATGTGKVNVGSFNGKLVVYASGLNGARISWKVGGNWGSAVADSNYDIFNRPTPRAGVTVSVQIYVNGVLTLTKSVLTR